MFSFLEKLKTVRPGSARPNSTFHIKNLPKGLDALLASAITTQAQRSALVVARDREEAAYFYNDAKNFFEQDVFLYPHVEHSEVDEGKATTSRSLRLEVMTALVRTQRPALVVSYPEAVAEKEASIDELEKNSFSIKPGEKVSIATLEDLLQEFGFAKVDFVYAPGEYAVRGGIVDIFAINSAMPYRVEFAFDEIEDMRVFSPSDQLSTDSVEVVTIFPKNCEAESSTYSSIVEMLPERSLVWIKDYSTLLDFFEQKKTLAQKKFEDVDGFAKALQKHFMIECGAKSYFQKAEALLYKASSQINFKQNIPLFAEALAASERAQVESVVVAETQFQLDRVREVLENNSLDTKNISFAQIGLSGGFLDEEMGLAVYTDHQVLDRFFSPKVPSSQSKNKTLTFKELQTLELGDYVVHSDFGIGKFAGLVKRDANGNQQEAVRLVYKDNDVVCVGLQSLHKISKYRSKDGVAPAISKLGTAAWNQKKQKVKARVKDIAQDLIKLYCKRRESQGFAFDRDNAQQIALEASFIYEDTPDQISAMRVIKADMEAEWPMDRLVCGDVGFGKTELAIRAAFKAVSSGKQVAVLVPTTLLSLQHYNSFSGRLSSFGVNVDYVSRFRTAKETKEILEKVKLGSIDVLIGTHKILSKEIEFKDLGLLVIDEEQKFGVSAKERIKELRVNLDILTLTATPIPRTMHFSLMGAKDFSIITTPPLNRQSIETTIHAFDKNIIAAAIKKELQREGQVIFVHNKIADLDSMAALVKSLAPSAAVDIIHGQMPADKVEKAIVDFMSHKTNVILATSIIESGVDIPNANTLIINDGHMFGLSDLHQMRGRVGRSDQKAYCHLFAPPFSSLSSVTRRRLSAFEEFSELGDGFKIAMRDLDIRGAGDILGAEQSGFIADVGFETYCQILDDAVQELKDTEFKGVFEKMPKAQKSIRCNLETDFAGLIPDDYVSNTAERIQLYTKLDSTKNDAELHQLQKELTDRFGPIPEQVQNLMELLKLRWMAEGLAIAQLHLSNRGMKCVFLQEKMRDSTNFDAIISFATKTPKTASLRQTNNNLVLHVEKISSIDEAAEVLNLLVAK